MSVYDDIDAVVEYKMLVIFNLGYVWENKL